MSTEQARQQTRQNTLRQILITWFQTASRCSLGLRVSSGDRARLSYHLDEAEFVQQQIDLLNLADPEQQQALQRLDMAITELCDQLQQAVRSCADSEGSTVTGHIEPVTLEQNGVGAGRPRKAIDPAWLAEALEVHRFSVRAIARLCECSERTVRRQILANGHREVNEASRRYTDISDLQLTDVIAFIREISPQMGNVYLYGALSELGIHVQRSRVRKITHDINPFATIIREQARCRRRPYRVAGPNSVWHHDGQHELIQFGVVVHGFIDGYTRLITGLRAASNNRALTVLKVFTDGQYLSSLLP
jgi:hypothetical protein